MAVVIELDGFAEGKASWDRRLLRDLSDCGLLQEELEKGLELMLLHNYILLSTPSYYKFSTFHKSSVVLNLHQCTHLDSTKFSCLLTQSACRTCLILSRSMYKSVSFYR